MLTCKLCEQEKAAQILQVCADCIKKEPKRAKPFIKAAYERTLSSYNLPAFPPESRITCRICANHCKIEENKLGYCGLYTTKNGKVVSLIGNKGLLSSYFDPHPTNCVPAWCCAGGTGAGYPEYAMCQGTEYGFYNFSIFMATCSMHCLFCQNYGYLENTKTLRPLVSEEELVHKINDQTTCLCFFGGCAVPQMPFVIRVARLVRKKSKREKRILRLCSETNGLEDPVMLRKFAELSLESGGGIKFDLKTYDQNLSIALSGTSNKEVYNNFSSLAELNRLRPEPPFLRASTLLVPHYIDQEDIRKIAGFIVSIDPNIPYSLLAFYPTFMMRDLPQTKREFAFECKEIAEKAGLKRVRIGNTNLLA
jgi:pyruvate formate lyase activating enzyme